MIPALTDGVFYPPFCWYGKQTRLFKKKSAAAAVVPGRLYNEKQPGRYYLRRQIRGAQKPRQSVFFGIVQKYEDREHGVKRL